MRKSILLTILLAVIPCCINAEDVAHGAQFNNNNFQCL